MCYNYYKQKRWILFLYAINLALYSFENEYQKRTIKYHKIHFKNFKLKNFSFPLKIDKISKFESTNKHLELSINVYCFKCKNNEIFPLQISKKIIKI